MKLFGKIFSILILITMLCGHAGYAFDLDETVDDEIRKNYNDTKLVEDAGVNYIIEDDADTSPENIDDNLPDLPNITKTQKPQKQAEIKSTEPAPQVNLPPISYMGGNIKIKKGSRFSVKNTTAISDWQTKGAAVNFKTQSQISTKNYTIPANTVFKGEIVESHQPQITCNGGLVAIKVYSMIYKGQTIPINAYVVRANDKKVFFNDIKGQRTYLKTMWKKGNWGRTLFNRMLNLTINLGSSNSTLILSPFPIAYGTICLGANAIVSPITAFFSKGSHVSIPAGSKFILKLNDDTFIY